MFKEAHAILSNFWKLVLKFWDEEHVVLLLCVMVLCKKSSFSNRFKVFKFVLILLTSSSVLTFKCVFFS